VSLRVRGAFEGGGGGAPRTPYIGRDGVDDGPLAAPMSGCSDLRTRNDRYKPERVVFRTASYRREISYFSES
jgi:hypothetical protein